MKQRRSFSAAAALLLLAAAAGMVTFVRIMIIEPIEAATLSSRDFTLRCEEIRGERVPVFYALGPDGDENKYMINVSRSRIFVPKHVADRDIASLPAGTLVVARLDKWEKAGAADASGWTALARGRIGRRDCALLEKKGAAASLR